jgi:hypothetical protein
MERLRMSVTSDDVLPPAACRDEETLRQFIQTNISPNAWPIFSPLLRRAILAEGIDLRAARQFSMDADTMERLIRVFYTRMSRIERTLGFDNAFHRALHNHEVLLRLLLLEWPESSSPPAHMQHAALVVHPSIDGIARVVKQALAALLETGVSPAVLARDVLAAAGHDYGHSGGTDRLDASGTPAPFTHEEMAEKHVAPIGLEFGMPVALVLESMAGIRATTFHSRPGRDRITAITEFERKLTLADIMGCALPPHLWLTHVGAPVLFEKLPMWRRRLAQIPDEIRVIDERLKTTNITDAERKCLVAEREVLETEDTRIIKHLDEWFRSERGFFVFIESARLGTVPLARALWGEILREKIRLMDRVLARRDLLDPLVEQGFALLERYALLLANAKDLRDVVSNPHVDPHLSEILSLFLPEKLAATAG